MARHRTTADGASLVEWCEIVTLRALSALLSSDRLNRD
jgi:hypothetical protein